MKNTYGTLQEFHGMYTIDGQCRNANYLNDSLWWLGLKFIWSEGSNLYVLWRGNTIESSILFFERTEKISWNGKILTVDVYKMSEDTGPFELSFADTGEVFVGNKFYGKRCRS